MRANFNMRIVSLILSVILMFSFSNLTIVSAESVLNHIYSEEVTVDAGDEFTIAIKINNNTGFAGFGLTLTYDDNILTPEEVTMGEGLAGGLLNDSIETSNNNSFDVVWSGNSNNYYNGELFLVKFDVDDNAYGTTPIKLSCKENDTFDENIDNVAFNCDDIIVNINNAEHIPENHFSIKSENATVGEAISVIGSVSDLGDLTSVRVALEFNSSVMVCDSVAGLSGTEVKIISNENGKVAFEMAGITSKGSLTELFKADFIISDSAIKGDYDIALDVTDMSGENRYKSSGCTIRVFAKDTDQPIVIKSTDVRSGELGKQLKVPIYFNDNSGLMGCKLRFGYDNTKLKPIAVIDAGVLGGYLDNNIGVKDGQFDVLWSDTANNYSNGLVFTILFDVLSEDGVDTNIEISYIQADTFNEEYEDVVLECKDVIVKLNQMCEHLFVNYTSNNDASCEVDGTEIAQCDYGCGETDTRTVENSKLGHKFTNYVSNNDATYTADGTKTATCDHGCGTSDTILDEGTKLKYTVIWISGEDVLATTYSEHGSNPVYDATVPTKAGDETYRYDFLGWSVDGEYGKVIDIENEKITSDMKYYAVFAKAPLNSEYYLSFYESGSTEVINGEIIGLLGDADCSGEVNIMDATRIQRSIAKLKELNKNEFTLADTDYSTEINIFDATIIQKWMAKYQVSSLINHYVYCLK